jgi:hypothetical protein
MKLSNPQIYLPNPAVTPVRLVRQFGLMARSRVRVTATRKQLDGNTSEKQEKPFPFPKVYRVDYLLRQICSNNGQGRTCQQSPDTKFTLSAPRLLSAGPKIHAHQIVLEIDLPSDPPLT